MFGRKKQVENKLTKSMTIEEDAKFIRKKILEIYGDELKYGGPAKCADQVEELIERLLKSYTTESDSVKSLIQEEADKLAFVARESLTHGRASDKIAKALIEAEERGVRRAILINTKEAQNQSYQKGYADGYVDGSIDMRERIAKNIEVTEVFAGPDEVRKVTLPEVPKKNTTIIYGSVSV